MFFFYLKQLFKKKESTPLQVDLFLSIQHRKKRTSRSASEEGSITVEATIVIPVIICVFLAVLMWNRVFLLHQQVEKALLETARELARQEHLMVIEDKEGLSLLMAKSLFEKNRKQGGTSSALKVSQIQMLGSKYKEKEKTIYLKVEYQILMPMFVLGTWKIPLRASVEQKAWNGYIEKKSGVNSGKTYVYITEHGEVYHTNSQCSHLHISIKEVEEVEEYYKNNTRFRPCQYCVTGEKPQQVLYITKEGECYHEDPSCGGLTRTVEYVPMEEVSGKSLCKDCEK